MLKESQRASNTAIRVLRIEHLGGRQKEDGEEEEEDEEDEEERERESSARCLENSPPMRVESRLTCHISRAARRDSESIPRHLGRLGAGCGADLNTAALPAYKRRRRPLGPEAMSGGRR